MHYIKYSLGVCNALRGREGWGGTELGVNQGVNVDRHMGAAELGRIYTKNDPDLHVHYTFTARRLCKGVVRPRGSIQSSSASTRATASRAAASARSPSETRATLGAALPLPLARGSSPARAARGGDESAAAAAAGSPVESRAPHTSSRDAATPAACRAATRRSAKPSARALSAAALPLTASSCASSARLARAWQAGRVCI